MAYGRRSGRSRFSRSRSRGRRSRTRSKRNIYVSRGGFRI